ncbi:Hypothetical predicted protein, partial [Paramuricea clavata]
MAKANTSLVFHQIHNNADLKDEKDPKEKGVKKFAKVLKAAYFNTTQIGNHSPYNFLRNPYRKQPFQSPFNFRYPPFTPNMDPLQSVQQNHLTKENTPFPPPTPQDPTIGELLPPQVIEL